MPLDTDFNVSPYFDDFDPAKKYYRILFRPSTAVQARELTQVQSIVQNQIETFASKTYNDGSRLDGCNPTVIPNLQFVRVVDNFTSNANAFVSDITSDYLLVGATSNVRAVAIVSKNGLLVNYPDTNRFYVKYISTGVNGNTTFSNNEVIRIYNANQNKFGVIDSSNLVDTINVISSNGTANAIGTGYGFKIEEGTIYQKGYFQPVDSQTIIVRDYDQAVGNSVIGFETIEEIITENVDESLLDNALGYSNENAPGAHRLKLIPTLVAKDRTEITSSNTSFFALYEFSNITNELVLSKADDPYSTIGDFIANRTYDESGDYVTKPFTTEAIEGSNTSTFAYQVSTGIGFIHGRRIEYLSSRSVETDRAITTLEANQQIITTNYGNYVYANQYSGALNFTNLITVDLYDAPFEAISNRYTPTLIGKNKIGTAVVKSVLHNEGDPGLPATTYRIFLTDINMNSGKSFLTNVKSIYANSSINSLGPVYADVANSSTQAVLQQSGKTSLVFPYGKKALKTLRSSNGTVNRTQFYFRASSSATMQTNGFIAVTTSSSYTGGTDRLGYSTGVLGDALESQFIVTVAANVSTANISGTINLNSTSTTISTMGLNSYFANGEFIKIYANSSTIDYRRVVSVTGTSMVIDAAPSTTNTTANFGKHYPAGYTIPLEVTYPGNRQVNVTSNTTFEISTGTADSALLTSTANVIVQYRMLRTNARQASKEVKKDRYIKVWANAVVNGTWNLGIPDVYNLKAVYSNTSAFADSTNGLNITQYFTFDSGQRDDYYDHGRLVLKPQYASTFIPGNKYLTVVVDHFSANLTNGVGFYSVDSYPTANGTANSSTINWGEIPIYTSGSTNIDLRDSVDFRAYKANTANSSTTLAGATVNPATTNNFISYSATYLSEADTNFQSDIEYYLGRYDLVTMNSTGGLGVIKGTPSENPRVPQYDTDVMVLATADVRPWPSLTARESETYGRSDYKTRTSISTNRGYTMRDIGVLDRRIQRLEYYTTLNQLEQQASNIQVPDANGLNRFKNGIFADPMTSHIFGSSYDLEYRWSIDSNQGYGRPLYSSENVDLAWSNVASSGVQLSGRIITRPYTHEKYIDQPFATKFRNNTQDLWSWNGAVNLYPTYDMNRDETLLPNIDASIDLTQPFIDFANTISQATGATIFGTRYGDWRTISSTSWRNDAIWFHSGGSTINQEQTVTNTFIVPVTNSVDLGRFVTDVSVQPYMKSRTIAFIARNLKPNTRIYAYFDDTPVSNNCAPAKLNTTLGANIDAVYAAASVTGKIDNVCVRTGNYGDALTTDQYGTLYGVFLLPAETFRIGDRIFQLLDSDSLITGADAALTRASATFTASNISVTSRNSTITAITPSIQQSTSTNSRTITTSWAYIEPIAQSLTINAPEEQSGVFATKLDLYFKSKDPNLGVKVSLVGMINGVPDSSTIYGTSRVASANVNVSDNATAATTFVFEQPIFLSANKDYAFYVETEGCSPEYKMWMSEMGYFDITTGAQVFANIYAGDAFRSSNAKTWTALPKEDVKFTLYVANFDVGTGTATFQNENDEYISYTDLALANSSIPVSVGDQILLVNSAANTNTYNTSTTGFVQFIDTTNAKLKIDSSPGGFANGKIIGIYRLPQQGNTSQANSTTLIATATINLNNPTLHAIVPRFATMLPSGTKIDMSFIGTSNSGVVETAYNDISLDMEREMLDFERVVYSRSTENTLGIGKSLTIKANMTNTNKYISPVIDLSRKSALVIKNIINNNTTDEHTHYGSAIAKYISKPIVLADGQEAEDIRIYLSAYRPINTDIEVYVRFLNNEDPDILDNKVWTKLVNDSPELRSSPLDLYDFKEYVYNIDTKIDPTRYTTTGDYSSLINYTAYANTSNYNIIEYVDSGGSVYKTYKSFIIKIVLISTNGIYVPKINDVRGIALQV